MSEVRMQIQPAFLVIADISGYTRFTTWHTTSLLHAETIITELLDAVIDQAEFPLTISKLEGDAVFLYATGEGDQRAAAHDVLMQVTRFFDAFREREHALISCNVCACEACRTIDKLTLKVFVHHGEVAIKQVRQFTELAGQPVILIHRLLKNSIPVKEYLLLTDTFYELSGGMQDERLESRTEHADDIGEVGVKVYYPPAFSAPSYLPLMLPAKGTPSADLYDRMSEHARRRINGLEPPRTFLHLPDVKLSHLEVAIGRIVPRILGALRLLPTQKRP
jgi:hypothetical protein